MKAFPHEEIRGGEPKLSKLEVLHTGEDDHLIRGFAGRD